MDSKKNPWHSLSKSEISEIDSFPLSVIIAFGFPAYYFVWVELFPQPYENLPLRLGMSFLGILAMLRNFWPLQLKPYFTPFWYLLLTVVLPFFFTFMLLMNNFNDVWISSATIAIFLTIIITRWPVALMILLLGIELGVVAFLLTHSYTGINFTAAAEAMPLFGFSLVVGLILNYRHTKTIVQQERQRASTVFASNLAHELRTPLQGIESGAIGIEKYLPELFEGYELAQKAQLSSRSIPPARYAIIKTGLQRIYNLAQQSNYIVSMAVRNLTDPTIDNSLFDLVYIDEVVKKAVSSYPYNKRDKLDLIDLAGLKSFQATVSETLLIHIIYNLLQNAFYHLAKSNNTHSGKIIIQTELGEDTNQLIFTDTGTGIPADILPHIFERFYTRTPGGNGVGLSFVRQVMEAFGGSVSCDSDYGEYCRFVLEFPAEATPHEN